MVERDWIDTVVDRLGELHPGAPTDAYQVTGRISRIAARLAQSQDEIFGRYGLNRGDVGVLSALRTAPPPERLSPTQLFRGLMLSSAGMTKRLDRLERLSLVKRKPDPTDRRGVTIELTSAGRQVLTKAVADNAQREIALLAGLKQSERRELGDLLRRVLRNVEPPTGGQLDPRMVPRSVGE